MLRNELYYTIKPYVPWRLRMAVRRVFAHRRRRLCRETWPIDESAGKVPEGWPGWPEGKRFAFVITHDVEGPDGLAKCRRLAELEMEMGFRSSFNFIPEGDYVVPPALRSWLRDHGFEVGIHDLHHDGKLFRSRDSFRKDAVFINQYLKEWGVVGFRSGFMLHEIDWIHDLEVEYASCTFDTDPFEPQSDGAGTIFPFWVPAPEAKAGHKSQVTGDKSNSVGPPDAGPDTLNLRPATSPLSPSLSLSPAQRPGYVELPYTLPQDSTLFLLLREKSPEIWLKKLDWIAAHGGMALINVHPDYLQFEGEAPSARTYPAAFFTSLFAAVRSRYGESFWNANAGQIARHLRPARRAAPGGATELASGRDAIIRTAAEDGQSNAHRCRRRVVMLVENSYPEDPRVRNEATLLRSAGFAVSVVCLGDRKQSRFQIVDGVRVYRIPRIHIFKKTVVDRPGWWGRMILKLKTLAGYTFEYSYFTGACFAVSSYIFLRRGFDVIHAHNPPDTLFLVALPFKFLGRKFVFDHHDLCPELFRSRYNSGEGPQTRILRAAEWCTLRLADLTIATNESYKRVQIERGKRDPNSIFIVRNGPDASKMDWAPPSPRLRGLGKCILVYVGALNPQDGVDYLLRALRHLRQDLGRTDFHCVIIGSGDSLEDLRAMAADLQLQDCVELTGFISDEELRANLAAADICVDPDPSSPLNDVSTWIKIMEYMAFAKPIVSFDLKETHFSAQEAAVYVPPNDELKFAQAIAGLIDAPEQRRKMGAFGRRRVEEELQWSVVGRNLLDAYHHLLGEPAPSAPPISEPAAPRSDPRSP